MSKILSSLEVRGTASAHVFQTYSSSNVVGLTIDSNNKYFFNTNPASYDGYSLADFSGGSGYIKMNTSGLVINDAIYGSWSIASIGNGGSASLNFTHGGVGPTAHLNDTGFGIGLGNNPATARLHAIGNDALSINYGLRIENSVGYKSFTVRNDGYVGVGTDSGSAILSVMGFGTGTTQVFSLMNAGGSKTLLYVENSGVFSVSDGYWIGANRVLHHQATSLSITNTVVGYNSSPTGANVSTLGYEATTSNTGNITCAFGYQAAYNNSGDSVIAVGYQSAINNTGVYAIGLGNNSISGNTGGYVIGFGMAALTNNTGNSVYAFGLESGKGNSGNAVVAFGNQAGLNNTQSNVILFGQSATGGGVSYIDMYVGPGMNRTNQTIHEFNLRQGTAQAGQSNMSMSLATLNIHGAQGTGTGAGGDIKIIVYPAGSTGSTQNAAKTAVFVKNNGKVGIDTATPNVTLDVSGDFATRGSANYTITADVNDLPTAGTSFIRLDNISGVPCNITGFADGYDGKRLVVANVGSNDLDILAQDPASLAGNRIALGGGFTDVYIESDDVVEFIYDGTDLVWRRIK